jgi:hypothetical protein
MIMGSMGTVTSRDGTPIAYERGSEGPPLVLVHGTTLDRTRGCAVLDAGSGCERSVSRR